MLFCVGVQECAVEMMDTVTLKPWKEITLIDSKLCRNTHRSSTKSGENAYRQLGKYVSDNGNKIAGGLDFQVSF